MHGNAHAEFARLLQQIPCGLFVLTASHEDIRSGVLVRWVQQCSNEPPMIIVSMEKGQPVEPLIRDSHSFVLCQISAEDRLLRRKFSTPPERGDDPFISLTTRSAACGAPILEQAIGYLECDVVRNIQLESDHRMYIGQVVAAGAPCKGSPLIYCGLNGCQPRIDSMP